MLEWIVKTYSKEGEIVLDNCCGSGTTAIACIKNNRNYIMFDNGKDENKKSKNYGRYWSDIAQDRINEYIYNKKE